MFWYPRNPITLSDDEQGVSNHLLNIVFRFHYHSQKVIGSLGIDDDDDDDDDDDQGRTNMFLRSISVIGATKMVGSWQLVYFGEQAVHKWIFNSDLDGYEISYAWNDTNMVWIWVFMMSILDRYWLHIIYIYSNVGKWLITPPPKQWSKGNKLFPIDYEENLLVQLILYC